MKHIITLLSFLCGISVALASDNSVKPYQLKFDDFHELKVVDGINVDYVCDASKAGLIEFTADASVASAVIFTPGKGRLSVSIASRDSVYRNLPRITVYSSMLSSVRNEGDSTVRVLSAARVPKLAAKLIGNGRLVIRDSQSTELTADIISGRGTVMITGSTSMARLTVTGAGDIQADDLTAAEASAIVTGTGSIACYATKQLTVGGLGSGKIYYRGAPSIKKKFLSTVKLFSIDNPENQ